MGNRLGSSIRPDPGARHTAALLRIMEAIGSTLDLSRVLKRLVEETLRVTGADRSVLFVLRPEGLVPRAAVARHEDPDLFRRFRAMDPIDLDEVERREALERRDVVCLEDARSSVIVPQGWIQAFGTRSLAFAPLAAFDEPVGVLVVDYVTEHRFVPAEIELIRGIANAARIAVGNAALHQRLARTAEVQSRLLEAMALRGSGRDRDSVLECIGESVSSLFRDGRARIDVVGVAEPSAGPTPAGRHRTVIPLRTPSELVGFLTLETPRAVDAHERELLEGFAYQAAHAIERARFTEDLQAQLRRTNALYRLAEVLSGTPSLAAVLERLNAEVCRGSGFECVEVAVRGRRLAALLGCRALERAELRLLRDADDADARDVEVLPGPSAVPIHVAGRRAGLLFVRSARRGGADRTLLRAVAAGIGDLAYKVKLQATLQRAEMRSQLVTTRRRLAEHLDRTAGSTLNRIWEHLSGLVAKHGADQTIASDLHALRNLTGRGLIELQTATESLAVLRVHSDGLQAALRALAATFERLTGISTTFRMQGPPRRLPPEVEEDLYGIAFEALSTIQRASRASTVVVELEYAAELTLAIRDDGVGLNQRADSTPRPGVHYGIGAIRGRVGRLGADLLVEPSVPRGVSLQVRLPVQLASGLRIDVAGADMGEKEGSR